MTKSTRADAPEHEVEVEGVDVDHVTRCAHWRSDVDIIALKAPCCSRWFACSDCHDAVMPHRLAKWRSDELEVQAILCGRCRAQLTISAYLSLDADDPRCPKCAARFNQRCSLHHHLYFEV